MAFDPYSLCPCGSGQKFKWCCQKVEAFAERAERQLDSQQYDRALETLDEGLRKEPGNPWLLSRKSVVLIRKERPEEAKTALRAVLAKQPKHLGAHLLLTNLVLETEGVTAGVAQLQQALTASHGEDRHGLVSLMKLVGAHLAEEREIPAARQHMVLAVILSGGEVDPSVVTMLRVIESNPTISPWEKDQYTLTLAPEEAPEAVREQFAQAVALAAEGRWSAAADVFGSFTSDPVAGAPAERNLGLCRLWLAEDNAAITALRRYIARVGATTEAVDLEALCQTFDSEIGDDLVEHVQLTWPLRDRDALLRALGAEPTVHPAETGPIDPDDENSPVVDQFALLDRPDPRFRVTEPLTDGGASLVDTELPKVVGRLLVAHDIVALDAYDDGGLDRLSERFTTLAGPSIAPAHPRTKVVSKIARLRHELSWEWLLPEGTDDKQANRLNREYGTRVIQNNWPNTPMPFLRGRTPLQAAAAGDAEVPLRAAMLLLENSRDAWCEGFDFAAFRQRVGISAEPPIDPATVDIDALPLARLAHVPLEGLSNENLWRLFRRTRAASIAVPAERAARELAARPAAMELSESDQTVVYSELAALAASRGERDEAAQWVRRGRQSDTAANRSRNAPHWDILEISFRIGSEDPAHWVPDLAVILERYRGNPEATQVVVRRLIDLGLVQMIHNPERAGEILLDSRALQHLLDQYGPRVTTASGRLGVSATRPEIWTPGASTGNTGAIWTPGASAGSTEPGGEKKIIITGR